MKKDSIKKKKGFTLMELLAVIVILGIIMVIAVVSFTSIRSKINETQYENLASTIKTAAKGYAEETGINKIFVQTLIDEGLIETDDETKILHDPRDNSSLNCQVLTYDKGNITLSQDDNPTCDITVLNDVAIKIQYTNDRGVKEDLPNNYWFNNNITLSVTSTGAVPLDLSKATYLWSSPLAPDRTYNGATYPVNGNYVDDTFQVVVTVDGNKYTAYANVKIDKTPPRAFNLIDKNPSNWTPNKTLEFEISDSESGISGWQITYDTTTVPTTWNNVSSAGSKREKITTTKNLSGFREGEYIYVWVKDIVGNTNRAQLSRGSEGSLQINTLDGNVDTVTLTGNPNNNTYTKSVTLSGTAQDTKSGLTGYICSKSATPPAVNASSWTGISKTNNVFNINCPSNLVDNNGTYYLHVKDEVGNIRTISYVVSNIDKVLDSATITDDYASYGYRESTLLRGVANDSGSGIVAYAFTTSASTPSSWTTVSNRKSLNVTYSNANRNTTYYFHVKDALGNTTRSSVTVSNLVKTQSQSFTLKSTTSSYISNQYNLYGAVKILDAQITNNYGYTIYNNGTVTATLYSYGYNNTTITVRGGTALKEPHNKTCSRPASSEYADSETYCDRYKPCQYGQRVGEWCVADEYPRNYYTYESNPPKNQTYTCKNKTWTFVSGESPKTATKPHYTYDGNYYNCTNLTGSCSNEGETRTVSVKCTGTATWDGNFKATCASKKTDYSCPYGKYLSGSTCYSCSYNETYNSYSHTCSYDCSYTTDYWQYYVTVRYYVLL